MDVIILMTKGHHLVSGAHTEPTFRTPGTLPSGAHTEPCLGHQVHYLVVLTLNHV